MAIPFDEHGDVHEDFCDFWEDVLKASVEKKIDE